MPPISRVYVGVLIAGMIATGSSNSLWSKYQDMQCVEDCDGPKPILYEQPVWQTLQMFVGEMLCFLPVIYQWIAAKRSSSGPVALVDEPEDATGPKFKQPEALVGWKIFLLWIPAACDLTATTMMNIGLIYTPVSIYQMTRGALVLFVGAFSVVFLKRRLWFYQWVSLLTVMAGVSLVGFAGSMIKDAVKDSLNGNYTPLASLAVDALFGPPPPGQVEKPEATTVLVGMLFVLFAQIFTATQFVVEEKIMSRYSVAPLVAVGFEGLFGTISILLLIPILSIPAIASKSDFFDLSRGWHQTIGTTSVVVSGCAIACSIALFNFFGLSVTRHVSATARSLTDTCRTLSIWIISLALGWERLMWPISVLQVTGFSLLVYGTFLFNDLVKAPPCIPKPNATEAARNDEEAQGLLSGIDETAVLPADLGQGFDVLPEGEHALAQPKVVGPSS